MSSAPDGLSVDKIHVWRGERHVLQGVSFELGARQLLQIVGPNGSGKTTLLRVVCGLGRAEQGEVRWRNRPIAKQRAEYLSMLAYAAHEPSLKSDLTALENLRFAVGLKRRIAPQELRETLERTQVAECADLPARVLSAGQRRRVAMARVLASNAHLWVLDEPFANLDGAGAAMLAELLQSHVRGGGAALVVAHHRLELNVDIRRLELGTGTQPWSDVA